MKCGCSETAEASIEDWERLYENRYGHKYVERPRNPYKNHIYQMPLSELKMELFGRHDYRDIIERIYPKFPKYLTRTDAVILFFDRAGKEGDLDLVRDLLSKEEQH